ncbi:zinc finger protein-like protein [Leptotrombidium deliense]|uniref:Zinc finger protein-like protein n=1 Tax=Leptotrombidium deliense TaxID=299467 RepID=A0A443SNS1_9ACAR|nr:zinc finger protein-like protein [Leptotrombidium deliense]
MSFRNNSTPANHSQRHSSNSRFGVHFDLPQVNIPYIKVANLSQTLSSAPQNLVRFMSRSEGERNTNCENCGDKFNMITRRKVLFVFNHFSDGKRKLQKTCTECSMDFCADCFTKDLRRGQESTRHRCRRCRVFAAQPPDRNALMSLRVRDLRWFLEKKGISAQFCNEKSELVDLVLGSSSSRPIEARSTGQSSYTYYPHASSSRAQDECESESNWVFVNDDDVREASESSNGQNERQRLNTEVDDKSASDDQKLFNINDLKSEDDIQNLSVRQLKLLLTRNFVNYKGCCEKEELAQKVLRLWRENQQTSIKDPEEIEESNVCKICMEREINCVLLECGHMIACNDCGKRLSECPICRQYIVRVIRTFKS